jgi:ABC-type branched-subunit amino acid transport system substrate-binding protein
VLAWNDAFNAAYGRQPSDLAKYVYDTTILMLTRINEVSTLDVSNNLLLDRAVLTMAVRNTSSFMGITGNITLEPDGDRVNLLTNNVIMIPIIFKK